MFRVEITPMCPMSPLPGFPLTVCLTQISGWVGLRWTKTQQHETDSIGFPHWLVSINSAAKFTERRKSPTFVFESVPRVLLQKGVGTLAWPAFSVYPSATAAFTLSQTSHTEGEKRALDLWFNQTERPLKTVTSKKVHVFLLESIILCF